MAVLSVRYVKLMTLWLVFAIASAVSFLSLRETIALNVASIVISKSVSGSTFAPFVLFKTEWFAALLQPTAFKTNSRAARSSYLAWGIICAEKGETERALRYWRMADSVLLWEHLANLSWTQGNIEATLEFYQRAILVEPSRLETHFILGRIYWQHLKRIEDAAKVYEKVVSIAPSGSFAQYLAKGYGFYIRNEWLLALQEFEMAIQQANLKERGMARDTETLVPVLRQAAYSAENIGNLTTAIQHFKEAIKLPHNSRGWTYSWLCIELGHVLIKDGKLAEASFWFSEAGNRRSDNPGLALAHEKLGKAYFDREDYSNAVVEFETAVNIKPEKYDYYYNLGSCYEKLRQWSDAANEYRKLLKIAPEDSLAQQALVRIDKMKQK